MARKLTLSKSRSGRKPVRWAIIPGSFDPPTLGHINVIERAIHLYDRVTVAVATNTSKQPIFSAPERVELIRQSLRPAANLEIQSFGGLLMNFLKERRGSGKSLVVLRGIRTVSDFEYELQIAHANTVLDPKIETVFMMTSQEYGFISSSIIKELVRLGGPINRLVPRAVEKALRARLRPLRK